MRLREYLDANETRRTYERSPFWIIVAAYIAFVPVIAVWGLWNGVIAMLGWNWFVAPSTGWEPIGIGVALGIGLLVTWLTTRPDVPAERTSWELLEYIGRDLRRDAFVLATMFVIHLFV